MDLLLDLPAAFNAVDSLLAMISKEMCWGYSNPTSAIEPVLIVSGPLWKWPLNPLISNITLQILLILLPSVTYSRVGELHNLATEFMLGDHIFYSHDFSD